MRNVRVGLALMLAGCGGLDNEVLKVGTVRGQVVGATAQSLVFVEGRPELVAAPGLEGRFELARVPQGRLALLVLASSTSAERLDVLVEGGGLVDVGPVGTVPGARVVLRVHVPSDQSRAGTRVLVAGARVPLQLREGEATLALPTGCQLIRVELPGLGALERELCVDAPRPREVEFEFPEPDGSPGREGCAVTGCEGQKVCRPNGACG